MRTSVVVTCAFLLAALGSLKARSALNQDKPAAAAASAEPKVTPEEAAKKNPVSPTSEGLAEARKLYGYDCAMCHGKDGDGKGDLVADMKLELHDWRDASTIEKMTDGELFWIITKGKGKMIGEGDRSSEKVRWNMVNLVRSFGKKGAAEKAKSESQQP